MAYTITFHDTNEHVRAPSRDTTVHILYSIGNLLRVCGRAVIVDSRQLAVRDATTGAVIASAQRLPSSGAVVTVVAAGIIIWALIALGVTLDVGRGLGG